MSTGDPGRAVETRFRFPTLAAAAVIVSLLLAGTAHESMAREPEELHFDQVMGPGEHLDSVSPFRSGSGFRADTVSVGNTDASGFAVVDGVWDFDTDLGGGTFQGWYGTDVTAQTAAYFRHITESIWSDEGNLVDAPILDGDGSAWVGASQDEADELCWAGGLGYGNHWCQRVASPEFEYSGSGNIAFGMLYFNDTEPDYDYTTVILRRLPSQEETVINIDGFSGQFGLAPEHPESPPTGATFDAILDSADFAGETRFQIVFEVNADEVASDEDGQFTTDYGPFGADDVSLSGSLVGGDVAFPFESGLDGWIPSVCPGVGTFLGVRDRSLYTLEDACECELSGNVLGFHNDDFEHPEGQRVAARSGPVDVANDVVPNLGGAGNLEIFADWDQYSVMPQANGVFYRPGWDYYPFECELGNLTWSGRVGQNTWYYAGTQPVCEPYRNSATDNGVPADIEQVRYIYELYSSCDAFGIDPEACTNESNFTPIIDNIQIRFTRALAAPPVTFDPGTQYQDGFSQSLVNDPDVPGRADITLNVNFGNDPPFVLGDSLYVDGPLPSSGGSWEAKLWFRIRREGPTAQTHASYVAWRDLYGGPSIVGENAIFAWAHMDSFQQGTTVAKNKFQSYLREDDSRYDPGSGEFSEENEIIRDDVLYPGTAVDYFVTSAYTATPNVYFTLPDTTGGFFREFEILPSWREDGGILKFPCLLYIDGFNRGAEFFIESALDALSLEHDRYDYLDAASGWKAPMARGAEAASNNGCTLMQLLGYRGILLNAGTFRTGTFWNADYVLWSDWLDAVMCEGNAGRQGFIANGDNLATSMTQYGSDFLHSSLGATAVAYVYADHSGDENYCVELEAPLVGAQYGTENSQGDYEHDAWGNWCPTRLQFDVMNTNGSGTGNRVYVNRTTSGETEWASVTNEVNGGSNYRTVIDGVSYHHLSEREAGDGCLADSAHIVSAATDEIAAALEWIFGSDPGDIPSLCEDPCDPTGFGSSPDGIPSPGVTQLFQNSPNPFNPRTRLSFTLAQAGPVVLTIHDVAGRRIRTLVNETLDLGAHDVVWDGINESGDPVSAGVYWSQLSTAGHDLNKKMVVLR